MRARTLLLCVAAGAVLGGSMIVFHQGPGIASRQAPSTPNSRNQARITLINQLASALTQYQKDHGSLPVKLSANSTQICTSYGTYCKQVHLTDLSFLTTEGDYIPAMPSDPLGSKGNWASGLFIQQLGPTIKITAPQAELGKDIEVTFTP